MSSIYNNLRTDKPYKAATGVSIAEFDSLYESFSQLYIPKTGNPYSKKTVPVLTHKREALFFILHYYKSYPTLQNLALYFGFSQFSASHYLDLLKPVLKASLERNTCVKTAVFTTQAAFDEAFAGVEEVFIDVTEVGIERAQNRQLQQAKYSGKKTHTVKWLIICDKYKRILFISAIYDGKTHDFTIFKAIFSGMDFSALKLHVDLGFLGIKKNVTFTDIFIAHKASKHRPLTEGQKSENSILAAIRVVVENAIAKLKAFFILRIENRMKRKEKLADAFGICTLLANFKNKSLIVNQLKVY